MQLLLLVTKRERAMSKQDDREVMFQQYADTAQWTR
jgi:hypothetical protein